MGRTKLFDHIKIDEHSSTPKYLQLSDAIINAIETGILKLDNVLPSINEISCRLDMARDTVDKGYRYLKSIGVIISVPGKGFYVAEIKPKRKFKVLLLFNKLSTHKKIIYDAFIAALDTDIYVDFYVYNNSFMLFKRLITEKQLTQYSHFVIIPHFINGHEFNMEIINTLPKEKLILMDKLVPQVTGNYGAVYEDFEQDIFNALQKALNDLSRYKTLKIVFPQKSYFPNEILGGFLNFAQEYAFSHGIVSDIMEESIHPGDVFIVLMEDDLVLLLERIVNMNLKIGKDVGVISYNETPIKKILLNGITTISTDFNFMGSTAARMLLEGPMEKIAIPFKYTKRNSL
ncbi:regulatory protein, gntR family [Pedobacter steynii]|uniref:Regulatory protein, gntR family n=1 Tax=Pedobacter steynii TaxID=430522 RepID=A0A1H0IWV3_9SPHI|nr:substrate-binding domain-containing protein [Pedobacter steynii]NQX42959.1 GntR family transcriptional regulator [Pedobacter steynii]SDO35710.1 regulatory protein, gntR family [Pedobacter steynii]